MSVFCKIGLPGFTVSISIGLSAIFSMILSIIFVDKVRLLQTTYSVTNVLKVHVQQFLINRITILYRSNGFLFSWQK